MTIGNFFNGLFATLLGVAVVTFGIAVFVACMKGDRIEALVGMGFLLLWIGIVEVPFVLTAVLLTIRCGSIPEPVMLLLAGRQTTWPRAMRPLLCIWWLLHLVFALAIPFSMAVEIRDAKPGLVVYLALLTTLFCGLSFGFATMAWACVDANLTRVNRFWAYRWWWGVFCGLAFLAVELMPR